MVCCHPTARGRGLNGRGKGYLRSGGDVGAEDERVGKKQDMTTPNGPSAGATDDYPSDGVHH